MSALIAIATQAAPWVLCALAAVIGLRWAQAGGRQQERAERREEDARANERAREARETPVSRDEIARRMRRRGF